MKVNVYKHTQECDLLDEDLFGTFEIPSGCVPSVGDMFSTEVVTGSVMRRVWHYFTDNIDPVLDIFVIVDTDEDESSNNE